MAIGPNRLENTVGMVHMKKGQQSWFTLTLEHSTRLAGTRSTMNRLYNDSARDAQTGVDGAVVKARRAGKPVDLSGTPCDNVHGARMLHARCLPRWPTNCQHKIWAAPIAPNVSKIYCQQIMLAAHRNKCRQHLLSANNVSSIYSNKCQQKML